MTFEERKEWLEQNRQRIIDYNYKLGEYLYKTNMYKSHNSLEEFYKETWHPEQVNEQRYLEDEMSNCKEKVNEIDLLAVLNTIRFNDYETLIVLYVKDNEILDEQSYTGHEYNVPFGDDEYEEIAKNANELQCDIYVVHNHPLELVAEPSGLPNRYIDHLHGDYRQADNLRKVCDQHNVKLLDWGVVSECDYFSYEQKKED